MYIELKAVDNINKQEKTQSFYADLELRLSSLLPIRFQTDSGLPA